MSYTHINYSLCRTCWGCLHLQTAETHHHHHHHNTWYLLSTTFLSQPPPSGSLHQLFTPSYPVKGHQRKPCLSNHPLRILICILLFASFLFSSSGTAVDLFSLHSSPFRTFWILLGPNTLTGASTFRVTNQKRPGSNVLYDSYMSLLLVPHTMGLVFAHFQNSDSLVPV